MSTRVRESAPTSPTTSAASLTSGKKKKHHRNPFRALFGKGSREKDHGEERASLAVKAYKASHTKDGGNRKSPSTSKTAKIATAVSKQTSTKSSPPRKTQGITTSLKGGNFLTRTRFFHNMLESAFQMVDADGSGEVDEQELYSGLLLIHLKLGVSLGPAACKPISREQCKKMFHKVDVDGSGTLSKEEFDAVMVVLFGNALLRVAFQYTCTIVLVPLLAQQILTVVTMMITNIYRYASSTVTDNTQVDEFGGAVWEKFVSLTPTALDNVVVTIYHYVQKVPPSVWNALPLTLTSTLLSMMLIPWSLMKIDDYFQSLAEKKKLRKKQEGQEI